MNSKIIMIDDITKAGDYVEPSISELWENRSSEFLKPKLLMSFTKQEVLDFVEKERKEREALKEGLNYIVYKIERRKIKCKNLK